jgi:hypothetical protein
MENNGTVLKHLSIIEFIILIIILILYKSKKIPNNYMTICLLGSYILIKSVSYYIHGIYHS